MHNTVAAENHAVQHNRCFRKKVVQPETIKGGAFESF